MEPHIDAPLRASRRGHPAETLAPALPDDGPEDGDTQEVLIPAPPTPSFIAGAIALVTVLALAGMLLPG